MNQFNPVEPLNLGNSIR